MTPDELTNAARELAHGLGIRVYIRDGRIYQHGPGIEFLPPDGASLTVEEESFFIEQPTLNDKEPRPR